MLGKLLIRVIEAAKKDRRWLIAAIACLCVLYAADWLSEAAVHMRKQYGDAALILLLCLLLLTGMTAVILPEMPASSSGLPVAASPVAASPVAASPGGLSPNEGNSESELPLIMTPEGDDGEAPYDREHPDTTGSVTVPMEDKEDPQQSELLSNVERYVGKLKTNQVTPDWAPDFARSGVNRSYYEKAWEAYEGLNEANRARLEAETLDYLLTCHRTIAGQ